MANLFDMILGKNRNAPPTPLVSERPSEIQIQNNLTDAIMGFNPGSIGTPVNQTDSMYINLRYYFISNQRQVVSQVYCEQGLVKTVVDVPVDDAFRGGVMIKSKQLSPEEIEELQYTLEREADLEKNVEAQKWNRLYGGAGLIAVTDQDWEQPLDLEALKDGAPLEFRAVDMWELFYDKQNVEGFNPALQEPKFEFYNYYGKRVHRSRVMKLKGLEAPSFVRPRLRGWGLSVLEALITSLNQYWKQKNVVYEIMDEFKVDYYKMKGLNQNVVSAEGTALVQRRLALANQQKNYSNAVVMDSDDEWLQKQLSFAGLADMPKEVRIQLASEMRMPLSKIFGIAATGFSSGEDDIENYNSMVESTVRAKAKPSIVWQLELRCMNLFGFIPTDLQVEFKPLRVLSSEQEENVKTQKFNRLLAALQAGAMLPKEFKDACNKDTLLVVQLDPDAELVAMDTGDAGEEGDEDGSGANEEDKQASTAKKEKGPEAVKSKVSSKKGQAKEAKQGEGDVETKGTIG